MGMFAIREMGSGGGGVGVAVELAEPLAMVALLGCYMLWTQEDGAGRGSLVM